MKFVLASNKRMYDIFLENFAQHKDCYKYIGENEDSIRGIQKDSIIILFENYDDNKIWVDSKNFRNMLNGFTNIFVLTKV
jgi:hypothetical protein